MCNAKPGKRCLTDSAVTVNKKTDAFREKSEHVNFKDLSGDEKHELKELGNSLKEAKIFLYASNQAQKNPKKALSVTHDANNKLSRDARAFLNHDERDLYTTGRFVAKHQEVADTYRKGEEQREKGERKPTQLDTARKMYFSGCEAVHRKIEKQLGDERSQRIAELLEDGSRVPVEERDDVEEVEEAYARNINLAEKAYDVASADAGKLIHNDIKKNSQAIEYKKGDKHRAEYRKNIDGSYTITTSFEVTAPNMQSVADQTEASFDLETVQMTVHGADPDNNTYQVSSKYVYKGGEQLEDAKQYQTEIFKGSPQYRQAQEREQRIVDTINKSNRERELQARKRRDQFWRTAGV